VVLVIFGWHRLAIPTPTPIRRNLTIRAGSFYR